MVARINGLDLLWHGPTAKAYTSLFGTWRKVTEVYGMVYSKKTGRLNTGRISVALKQLQAQGYLAKRRHPSTTWQLYTATIVPVVEDALLNGVVFDQAEVELASDLLGCAADKPVEEGKGGLLALNPNSFVPPLSQARAAVGSAVCLSAAYLTARGLEGKQISDYLSTLHGALEGKPSSVGTGGFASFSTALALKFRSDMSKGRKVEDTSLFKFAKYSGHPDGLVELMKVAKLSL